MTKIYGIVLLILFSSLAWGGIVVTPNPVDLGNVDRGSGAQSTVSLKNTFAASTTFTIGHTGNFVISSGGSTRTLAANETITIHVDVEAGVSVGSLTGTLDISGGGESLSVPLHANVTDLFASQFNTLQLNFGTVNSGQAKSLPLTVQNQSTGSLVYSGTPSPSLYTVSPASVTVAAGQSGTLTVTFTAGTTSGSFPGTLSVKAVSGASNQTVGTATLSASIPTPPPPPPPAVADLIIAFNGRQTVTKVDANQKRITVPFKVTNIGAGAAGGSSAMKIFLDGTFMNGLGVGALQPGVSQTNSVIVTIPTTTTGNHTLRIEADANKQVTESNENNNSATTSIAL